MKHQRNESNEQALITEMLKTSIHSIHCIAIVSKIWGVLKMGDPFQSAGLSILSHAVPLRKPPISGERHRLQWGLIGLIHHHASPCFGSTKKRRVSPRHDPSLAELGILGWYLMGNPWGWGGEKIAYPHFFDKAG